MNNFIKADCGALNQFYNGALEKCPQIIIQLNLSQDVNPESLKTALKQALEKYSVYSIAPVLNEKGEPGFVPVKTEPPVFPFGNGAKDYGSAEVGGYLVYVEYEKNKLYVNLHHAVADGCGAADFSAYLLCCYLKEENLIDQVYFNPLVDLTDTADPFDKYGDSSQAPPFTVLRKNEFTLPHEMGYRKNSVQHLYSFRFDITKLLKASKKAEASVLPVMIGMVSRALYETYNIGDKTLVGTFGLNCRRFYNSNTPKNFSQAFSVAYLPRELNLSLEEQATCQRGMMDMYLQKETVDFNVGDVSDWFANLDKTQFLNTVNDTEMWDKKRIAQSSYSAYFLTYLGKFNIAPEALPFIKNVTAYLPGTRSPLTMTATALGNIMNLTAVQSFKDDTFVSNMKKQLENIGIEVNLRYEGEKTFASDIIYKQL